MTQMPQIFADIKKIRENPDNLRHLRAKKRKLCTNSFKT